ncbi:MAG: hypothetical protein ACOX0L_08640 [Natronincolaceae bacterium]|jgi:hypothetical protein|nr:hypothetical protein [Bacillota bacterium]NLK90508.1 hypothetical protein [Clostridiales bacterium]
MKKPITINLGINPVVKERAEKALPSINADLMGLEEIKMKLQEGYEDIEKGKVRDVHAVFARFRENKFVT